jgi:hypothetical protein
LHLSFDFERAFKITSEGRLWPVCAQDTEHGRVQHGDSLDSTHPSAVRHVSSRRPNGQMPLPTIMALRIRQSQSAAREGLDQAACPWYASSSP